MNHPFFFLCPACSSEDSFLNSYCLACKTKINISRNHIEVGNLKINFADYHDLLVEKLVVKQNVIKPTSEIDQKDLRDILRTSEEAILRQGSPQFNFSGYHHLFRRIIERPREIGKGYLIIFKDHIEFISKSKRFNWHPDEISCITTNGHYFEFKIKHKPFYQIYFSNESPLKYEIIFRKWLDQFYQDSRKKKILEFQPRVLVEFPKKSNQVWALSQNRESEKDYLLEKLLLSVIKFIMRKILRLWIKVKILSSENWSTVRNGFTILNHQSAIDPFIVAAFLDRKIAFLTKSTSFTNWFSRFFLRWVMGVPTTRYQTDPEVIYFARKLLSKGIKVGIFPEGERTWGGRLNPFKMSLIKLLMASREAITPIVLKNAFHFWPRWAKFPWKTEIQILVGAPFCLVPELYSIEDQKLFLEQYFKTYLKE